MTIQVYDASAPEAASAAARRKILLSPFGCYTRYMLRAYAQHAFIVTAGLLIVALSIELSPRVSKLLAAKPEATGIWAITHLGWYLTLRGVDFLTQLLPLGCFLGVLWCEVALTLSRERVVIWNSGRSPLQCLVPVLLLALCVGVLSLVLETYARPTAVMIQASEKLGDYGEKFSREPSSRHYWLAAGDDLVHARIDYGPPPALLDLTIYRHRADGNISEIISARSASPGEGENKWRLRAGNRWRVASENEVVEFDSRARMRGDRPFGEVAIADQEIELRIDPLWLSHYRIYPRYLPHSVLETLASGAGGKYAAADYQTWLHFRYAAFFLPGGMVLLATSLSLLLLAHGVRLESVLAMGFVGYGAHISMKAGLLLGENAYTHPIVAAWFTPTMLIAASVVILCTVKWRSFQAARMIAASP